MKSIQAQHRNIPYGDATLRSNTLKRFGTLRRGKGGGDDENYYVENHRVDDDQVCV
jgi:hypothetical protein